MTEYQILFEPIGRHISIKEKTNLLTASQEAGIAINAVCGGIGLCQDCKIRCLSGTLSSIQPVEMKTFTIDELSEGWRLACQAYPTSDVKVEIPPESMTTTQRMQIEGTLRKVKVSPVSMVSEFTLLPPNLEDLRADWERFLDWMDFDSEEKTVAKLPVIAQFSNWMREWNWTGKVVLGEDQQIIGFLPNNGMCFGLAVDIGTTKMAGYLVDLMNGEVVAKLGMMNPQIVYGEDVISRIAFADEDAKNRLTLQTCLVDGINDLMENLCNIHGIEKYQVVDFVIVGNTAMHHLFTGLSVSQLGQAPYIPAVKSSLRFSASEVGLLGAPGANVFMPPNIAGFVGADHIAMLLACDLHMKAGNSLAIDIGTNTEVSLSKEGQLVSCSCASGPAFEGAHIHAGMRASAGAIERAQFYEGGWHMTTIENQKPTGICGSGIVDVVAQLLISRQIDSTGRFTNHAKRRIKFHDQDAIILVPAELSGTGEDILVTRNDIREIQLAKAAIRAGINALLQSMNTRLDEIDHFIIAGAFGTYLNIESAVQIGMFPKLPKARYLQIGNAAGTGAQQMLISKSRRIAAEMLIHRLTYLELTTDLGFMDSYVNAMGFE